MTAYLSYWPRGCGKTTVGHALARARHFQFSDTDHRLQAHEQRTVAEIVQAEGWARFRELETLSLKADPAEYGNRHRRRHCAGGR